MSCPFGMHVTVPPGAWKACWPRGHTIPRSETIVAAPVVGPGEDGELASADPAAVRPPPNRSVVDATTTAVRRLNRVVIDDVSREMVSQHIGSRLCTKNTEGVSR